MKIKLLLATLLLCSACANVPVKETYTDYLLPNSLIEFTGTDMETAANGFSEWIDKNQIIDCSWTEDGIILTATDQQRDRIIGEYIGFAEDKLSDLMEENDFYKYSYSSDYKTLNVYIDERVLNETLLIAIVSSVYGLGLSQVMKTGDPDWKVTLTVYNCHTGKEVGTCTLPGDGLSINDDDWKASY